MQLLCCWPFVSRSYWRRVAAVAVARNLTNNEISVIPEYLVTLKDLEQLYVRLLSLALSLMEVELQRVALDTNNTLSLSLALPRVCASYLAGNNLDYNVSQAVFDGISQLAVFTADGPAATAACTTGERRSVHDVSFCVSAKGALSTRTRRSALSCDCL